MVSHALRGATIYVCVKGISYDLRFKAWHSQFHASFVHGCSLGAEELKNEKDMTQELTNAIKNYVNLLPDLFASPNDSGRLLMVAYQLVMNEERIDEEFDNLFMEILSGKFKDYSQDAIISFIKIGEKNYVTSSLSLTNCRLWA